MRVVREAEAMTNPDVRRTVASGEGSDLATLLEVAHQAVDLAERYLLSAQVGLVTAKGDRDMVSEADIAVERLVREFLADRTPDIGFHGEEAGVVRAGDRQWVLDPIDGTANVVHGLPLAGIALALRHGDRAMVGVIGLPWLGQRYSAAERLGATCNGGPISAASTTALADAMVAVGDYGTGTDAAARNRADHALHRLLAARVQRVRMFGSAALDLVWVAAGKLDASVTLGNRAWDMAAGAVIAREAGAVLVDHEGVPHDFTSTTTIAVAPGLCEEVTALVREAITEAGFRPPAPR